PLSEAISSDWISRSSTPRLMIQTAQKRKNRTVKVSAFRSSGGSRPGLKSLLLPENRRTSRLNHRDLQCPVWKSDFRAAPWHRDAEVSGTRTRRDRSSQGNQSLAI